MTPKQIKEIDDNYELTCKRYKRREEIVVKICFIVIVISSIIYLIKELT